MTQHEHRTISVSQLRLDPDNPRFFHLAELEGRKNLTQDQLLEEIANDDETIKLTKAIRKSGVSDPIWVKDNGDSTYLVVEGNRRTTVLKKLLADGATAPDGVRFDQVSAHILPPETSDPDLLLQKARLQSGKKKWGAFNEAAVTYKLRHEHEMEYEDIAAELQLSVAKVKERITNYVRYQEYSKQTGDSNPQRFAFFSDAPKKVRDWVNESDQHKKTYFELINPTTGTQKIRSVATKGGLRDFAQVIEDQQALETLVTQEDATVEDAVEIARENDIQKGMPFIKKIRPLAAELNGLTDAEIARLAEDRKTVIQIRSLTRACKELLSRLEEDDE